MPSRMKTFAALVISSSFASPGLAAKLAPPPSWYQCRTLLRSCLACMKVLDAPASAGERCGTSIPTITSAGNACTISSSGGSPLRVPCVREAPHPSKRSAWTSTAHRRSARSRSPLDPVPRYPRRPSQSERSAGCQSAAEKGTGQHGGPWPAPCCHSRKPPVTLHNVARNTFIDVAGTVRPRSTPTRQPPL